MFDINASIMTVSEVPESDVRLFMKWIWEDREKTNFDPDTLTYPRSCMTRATNNGETTLMIPLQPVLFFESMTHKPDMTNREIALSMLKIGHVVEEVMQDSGHHESYFITNDEPEVLACSKNGWVVVLHDAEKKQWLLKKRLVQPEVAQTTEA